MLIRASTNTFQNIKIEDVLMKQTSQKNLDTKNDQSNQKNLNYNDDNCSSNKPTRASYG